ncbi:hypothetical protein DS745_11745 [Anaerobacillus alkaliphilus]|uniref:Uncharacterized protein n=1 Tax=Anaerobacillus alkaliphilus TaxID=1548597 RepID=A0A4Q0VSD9_9BACI|nr:hypothetical protein [Anaerobacillus alkaliphilus]RXJ00723.1 hypothetical protein DS745_11745 [Anaerobacillus alkaliphilus]
MNVIEQSIYDIKLEKDDELGRELVEIISTEKKQHKRAKVLVHQVIQIDDSTYTAIINILEE